MKQKSLLFLILIAVLVCVKAQNTNPLDKQNTPPPSSLFGQDGGRGKFANKFDEQNANRLRISITDFARSQVRLVYERKLGANFAITGGFGLSFGADYIENIATSGGLMEDLFEQNGDGVPLRDLQYFSSSKSGYSISTSLKYALVKDEQSVYFMEFGYKYAHLNYQSLLEISGIPVQDPMFDAHFNHVSISLGKSYEHGIGKIRFIHEFSYGLGLKMYSWDKYSPVIDAQGHREMYVKDENQKISNSYPIFILRYQVGLSW